MSTSRLRFQHYRASWIFAMLALMFSSFAVTASDHFLINNADGELTIGPLDRIEDITTARTRLDKNNLHYSLEDTPAKESLGFIVISREYTSNSAASDDLQRLADSGIKDYLYVARGDYADRISVGVFSQHAVAQIRAATLNNLGFAFSVIERFHTTDAGTSIVIREPGLGIDGLERILADQVAKDEPIQESIRAERTDTDISDVPVPEPGEGELSVEKNTAEPVQKEETITIPNDPVSAVEIPAIIAPSPNATSVIRTQQPAEDSGWLWYLFAGVALIVVGALAYYYRQQRSQNEGIPPPQSGEPAPVAAKPSKEELLDISTSPEPPTQQVIFDYAEAVLEGKRNHPSARSLTILGTEDTSIMFLMRDLLLLVQLEEKKASVEAFAFDSRSLVENLITRLSAENPSHSASLRSAPSEDLPLYLSLDANKLSKILSILLQQAIERTDTGLISIHQQFKSDQLIIEIHYHPSGENVAIELEAMTNPALHNTSLSIGERVKFGVANRLALVLDGRLATNFSSGKAIVSICLPAVEIQTQQLSLPYGKSIDELIAAEARSKEEMERAERAEAFAQQQAEMLQEALGDAQSAHKTGDAIRKVTRHLKSKVKKLESQIEELGTNEPEAIEQKLADLEEIQSGLAAKAERAEAFAQQQTEMLQEALGDAQSAHKTGDAIRKVTRHLKSKVKKLESQIEELGTNEPGAIVIEDIPDEPIPDRTEPEPAIEDKPALILQEPDAPVDVGPKPEQAVERFKSSEDVVFSLEDFAEQEAIAWLQGQIDSRDKEPSASLNKEPSASLNKEPSASLNKEPSASLNKEPSASP
ncbi:MAG TPA: hypothetical protein EYP91_12335, partial [Gammaproteobacteria bacterium]|nr:hypothetical protein [Gammaproteobacteria bacterium]